jgi:lipopolysaccharide export system protein LptC
MSSTTAQGLEALQPTHHGRWEPRRALTLNAARRRTAFVRLLRFGFMAAAAAIVALLIVQLVWGGTGGPTDAPPVVGEDVRMINPSFYGRDENLTPYAVTADVAIRRRSGPGTTDLEQPRLNYDFLNVGDEASRVVAETGAYDPEARILDLFTNVNLQTEEGYTFNSEHARVFLNEERVAGEEPVEGTGPMGTIRADRFEIRDGGQHVIFEGRVRARIIQDRTTQVIEEEE